MNPLRTAAPAVLMAFLLSSCAAASDAVGTPPAAEAGHGSVTGGLAAPVQQRLAALQAAVDVWERADDLPTAKAGAETARNLVTGPDVSGYGDVDEDGRTGGANETGLLPGAQGQPGLVTSPASVCVERDVLGGSWDDPAARWEELDTRITAWSETVNTFPALASHPQRVVGWASLTLATSSLELAREYASHAQLHVRVAREALNDC